MKGDRVERFLGRIFIAFLTIICMLGILEIASRKFMPSRPPIEQQFPVQVWRQPQPYVMFSGQPGGNGLNSLGYKGNIPQQPKPQSEFRVFFLGGSTTVVGDPPIAELVQDLFQQAGFSDVRVYNFGVISSVSSMELSKIIFQIADLEPDLIVMYNGGNDTFHPLSWDPRPGYPFNFIAYENNPLLDKKITEYPTFALLAYGSNFLRRFFPTYFIEKFVNLAKVRTESNYLSAEWKDKIVTIYLNNLKKAHAISKAFGADFVTFYQPLLCFKDVLSNEEQRIDDHNFCTYFKEMRSLILDSSLKFQEDTIDPVKFVDLSQIYQNNHDWIFTDIIHTRQEAKPIVAQAIFRYLCRLIKKG